MAEEAEEEKEEAEAANGETAGGASEAVKSDQDDARLVTSCWACGSKILLPEDGIPPGLTADEVPFECGGCGANNLRDHRSKAHAGRGRLRQCCRTASHTFMKIMGIVLIVFVPLLIVGMFVVAIWNFWLMPLPFMCFEIMVMIGLWFIVMTLWTFTLAATTKAGSPALGIKSYGSPAAAADGRLKGFSFCYKCEIPRAHGAHHCSVCRRCIHDMDHHCPYINNCVGYYNRRIFVQFTMYASCACYYAIACLSIAVAVSRDIQNQLVRGVAMAVFSIPGNGRLLSYAGRSVNVALWKSMRDTRSGFIGVFLDISLALYMLVGFLVAVLVGGLFIGQMQMLCRDTTALEYSIMQQPRPGWREGWSNIKKTMGPLRTWLWPQRHPLPPELGGKEAPRILEEIDAASQVEDKKDM